MKTLTQADLLEDRYKALNRSVPAGEMVVRPDLRIKYHPDSRLAFEAFCFRCPQMVAEMDRFIDLARDKRRLLDVGALHGIFSLVFTAGCDLFYPMKKSIAVEPSPRAFARLLYNIHNNWSIRRNWPLIVPVERALSSKCGVISMHYEWEHAVVAGTDGGPPADLTVEKNTGDHLCGVHHFDPDIIKVDVEGHEVEVLKGLMWTIGRFRPLIFLEIHPARIQQEGNSLDELAHVFADLEYRTESIDGEPFDLSGYVPFEGEQHLIAFP